MIDLYEQDNGKGMGLSIVPKLKYEHCYLTSSSKMRVDLAAQVCNYELLYSHLRGWAGNYIVKTYRFSAIR